jgi:hypothetical protein
LQFFVSDIHLRDISFGMPMAAVGLSRQPPTAIGLTTIFFLPIFAALLAIRYRNALSIYLAPW